MPSLEANQLLSVAVDAADSRKAEDIRILALDPAESSLTDYFLICSGTNERQNAAISDEIEYRLKQEFGVYPNSVEGRRQGEWVLMDYVDFVVHIFMPEKRAYYGLERLRKSAKSLTVDELNDEIKQALEATRAKTSAAKRAAIKKSEGEVGRDAAPRKTVAKVAATKATTKKSSAKPASAKAAAKKTAATKSAAPSKKSVAKKTALKKNAKG